jgi:hypothetical protein
MLTEHQLARCMCKAVTALLAMKLLPLRSRRLAETPAEAAAPLVAVRYVMATGDMYAQPALPQLPATAPDQPSGIDNWTSLPSQGTLPVNRTASSACSFFLASKEPQQRRQVAGKRKLLDVLGADDRVKLPQSCSRTYPW